VFNLCSLICLLFFDCSRLVFLAVRVIIKIRDLVIWMGARCAPVPPLRGGRACGRGRKISPLRPGPDISWALGVVVAAEAAGAAPITA
jgi:hypothetical protein